jgi:hypothetical protein
MGCDISVFPGIDARGIGLQAQIPRCIVDEARFVGDIAQSKRQWSGA